MVAFLPLIGGGGRGGGHGPTLFLGPYGRYGNQQGWDSWSYGTVVDRPETRYSSREK